MAKIFWDKGHGGVDSGAVGNGLMEKTLTHKIVEYAMAYMSANYTVFEQRTSRVGDTYPSLGERARMANAWGADLFISVHINAGRGNGYESYVFTKVNDKTVAFQNVLNAEIMAAMRKFGDIKAHGGDDTKQANFQVLRETNMPAVLTENLYIDSSDASYLKNEAFIKAVGEAHARGVAKFLGLKQKETAQLIAPQPESSESGKIVYISTGGYAGTALGQVHDYLFKVGHGFNVKRGADGSVVFLIGPFDTSQPNFCQCEQFLRTNGHGYELISREKAEEWKQKAEENPHAFIYTGGFLGAKLLEVHDYLFKKGFGFDVTRGDDGSLKFKIGPFDLSQPSFWECRGFFVLGKHEFTVK